MRIEYDKDCDAMYMYVQERKSDKPLVTQAIHDNVILDYDDNKLYGIEILGVSQFFSNENLEQYTHKK